MISQETFDLAVAENMEEFSMEQAEAVRDAREQFQQQGINLANIVVSEMGSQRVVRAVKALFQVGTAGACIYGTRLSALARRPSDSLPPSSRSSPPPPCSTSWPQ